MENEVFNRAQGCLLGQLAGDSLGSLVEFKRPDEIKRLYPNGVCDLEDGGTWDTIAGQPTDDSEMALLLARMLVKEGSYRSTEARKQYVYWLESGPFDCGRTILSGLTGNPNHASEANGALMRISPLGIFGAMVDLDDVAKWAREDAAITHPHPVCLQANALFAMALSRAIRSEVSAGDLYAEIMCWAAEMPVDPALLSRMEVARDQPPHDYCTNDGWVLVALHNALFQLLHAPSVESGIVDSVMRGGDTDTNAAICGSLMGAVYGIEAIPERWVRAILNCRPEKGKPGVHKPRPDCFWPMDAMELAEQLVGRNGNVT